MAKSPSKAKSTPVPVGHSGDGSGAKFVKWMQDDMAAWPEKTGADQRDVKSFDDELWGLSKEIERVEGELKSLKENHKDLSDKKKHAEEYPAHIDIRNFHTAAHRLWGDSPSMEDLRALAFISHNPTMLSAVENFKR